MALVSKPFLLFMAISLSIVFPLMSGCASGPPTQEELSNADYGPPISQELAQRQALEFLKGSLKDPGSARIDWSTVSPGWMREAPLHGGSLKFGYVLNASVNAKNSYGGYIGYKPFKFLFFNGKIISVYAQQELGSGYSTTSYMGKIY